MEEQKVLWKICLRSRILKYFVPDCSSLVQTCSPSSTLFHPVSSSFQPVPPLDILLKSVLPLFQPVPNLSKPVPTKFKPVPPHIPCSNLLHPVPPRIYWPTSNTIDCFVPACSKLVPSYARLEYLVPVCSTLALLFQIILPSNSLFQPDPSLFRRPHPCSILLDPEYLVPACSTLVSPCSTLEYLVISCATLVLPVPPSNTLFQPVTLLFHPVPRLINNNN